MCVVSSPKSPVGCDRDSNTYDSDRDSSRNSGTSTVRQFDSPSLPRSLVGIIFMSLSESVSV